MIKQLCLATKNEGKAVEFKEMLKSLPIELHTLAEFPDSEAPEETGKNFSANARLKAQYYAKLVNMPCLADDSGLECFALNGAPGVLSARYSGEDATDKNNVEKLLLDMKFCVRRGCRFKCVLSVALPNGKILNEVDGICEGMLLHEPVGENGFGYDPVFWSTELHKGFGEATDAEKNTVSHRAKAVKKLVNLWAKQK
ncbi:MAG: RdgB/HAM1 family non-canonical purine NTP pyrophosphatase [Acidaminococcaceae bacterium]|nr:RdgB/HAM1 family non-canonical purine NTP pyrophosphatase [Acidaminococcaceae bacterium]